ncbi:hypothetical protein Avi_5995 [Allorhizobium ampelinum S4]|uniref:Uncharacterized protein n=1 Tax=Allorhizobium ampelinum (strain ATCC BAA-846 / DSM 112012 / S4) TaxID=311402 RepID=B9K2B7_ALLAM|nr:hypothetical protein Avi_5995 [Allorhizobium ampelinum S4]
MVTTTGPGKLPGPIAFYHRMESTVSLKKLTLPSGVQGIMDIWKTLEAVIVQGHSLHLFLRTALAFQRLQFARPHDGANAGFSCKQAGCDGNTIPIHLQGITFQTTQFLRQICPAQVCIGIVDHGDRPVYAIRSFGMTSNNHHYCRKAHHGQSPYP